MTKLPAALLTAALLLLAGCHIDTHHGQGDSDRVHIATPFGGVSVKTNQPQVQSEIGLALYPGAVSAKKQGQDSSSADVNLSFGGFHLGVRAADYTTPDAPAKVLAFYRKDLAQYGPVVHCIGRRTVGSPAQTPDGLGCDSDSSGHHIQISDGDREEELKAGSRQHQHLVKLKTDGSGTNFSLVALDLPQGLSSDDDNSKE